MSQEVDPLADAPDSQSATVAVDDGQAQPVRENSPQNLVEVTVKLNDEEEEDYGDEEEDDKKEKQQKDKLETSLIPDSQNLEKSAVVPAQSVNGNFIARKPVSPPSHRTAAPSAPTPARKG